jgi:DNA-binding winged helix-turn-helix (wHTH) protein
MRVEFGDCTLDSDTRELFRKGQPVHLSPKAFRLLELLLDARPKALSKSAIHEKVWPDAVVSEATLASLIAEIRDAVGDSGKDSRYIRTVHGFGYAFSGAASGLAPRPAGTDSFWRLLWEDREIPLPEGETTLGRDHLAGISIPSESVSRRHARIVIAQGKATLEDLGSKNGTYVGGKRISPHSPVRLSDGDEFRVGSATMILRFIADTGSTQTEIQE